MGVHTSGLFCRELITDWLSLTGASLGAVSQDLDNDGSMLFL